MGEECETYGWTEEMHSRLWWGNLSEGVCLEYIGCIHSFSILSDDRSKASSKTMPPHSAI